MSQRFAEVIQPVNDQHFKQAQRYYDASDFDAARKAVDESLRLMPQDYATLHLAGIIATAQKRLPAATDFLKQALQHAPDSINAAASWCALGKALRAAGDLRQAEEALRRAIIIDPHNCNYPVELADIYAEGWNLSAAIKTLKKAVNRFFSDPLPCVALGNLLNRYGKQSDAFTAYGLAIQRKPDFAEAHLALGSTLAMLGRFEEAEQALREALRLNPTIKACYQLAQAKKFKLDSREIDEIKSRLDPQLNAPKESKIDALFALSKIYDKQKDFASAFHYLNEATLLHRSASEDSISEYQAMCNRIISLFTPEFLARYSGKSTSDLSPIFVLGMFRSGTTLMEQILASHSQVQGGGELLCIVQIAKQLSLTWTNRGDSAIDDDAAVIDDLIQSAASYRRMTAHISARRPRFTDKLPLNFFYIGIIHLLFPKASIIYCHRNPIATCFSCYQNNIIMPANGWFTHDLTDLGRYYKLHNRMMRHWWEVLPGRILNVEYESLVESPEAEIRRILKFCNLGFEPGCLEFHATKHPVATASIMQVRNPIYKSGIDHWKNYEQFLGPLIEALR
jgi:tetratricopeptide (TPR) repeat protein